MAAEVLARGGAAVTVYERMPSVGRKFLLAGPRRAQPDAQRSARAFLAATARPAAPSRRRSRRFRRMPCAPGARRWARQPSSDRAGGCSRKAMKASPLLRAWLRRLDAAGVSFKLRHRWTGWDDAGRLALRHTRGRTRSSADATVLALGGASWPHLGSDGAWVDALSASRRRGRAAAAGQLRLSWSPGPTSSATRFAGQPLKRIALSFGDQQGARRSDRHRDGPRRRRHLCAVGAAARGHRRHRRGASCTSICAPT